MRVPSLVVLALLVGCEAPPVPPSAAPTGPAVPAAGDVPPADGGVVTGAPMPGGSPTGNDGAPLPPGADGAQPMPAAADGTAAAGAPPPGGPPPGAPPAGGAPGELPPPSSVTPEQAAAAAPPSSGAPVPTEGPPSFKTESGKTVTLSGEVSYSGAAKGTYRLDFFEVGPDGRPLVLAVKLLDGAGSWEVDVPQGRGALYVMAYIDAEGNGPDAAEPAAVAGPLTVANDAISGVRLALTPGGAGAYARGPGVGTEAAPAGGASGGAG